MARRPKAPAYDPVPMFDLDAYCVEHPASIKRIRSMQEAAQDEALDYHLPLDARRHNLTRMRDWIDRLLDRISEGDDHAYQPDPWRSG